MEMKSFMHHIFKNMNMMSNTLIAFLSLVSCNSVGTNQSFIESPLIKEYLVIPNSDNIINRFKLPKGYQRVKHDSSSFAYYLSHLHLQKHASKVHLFDGTLKANQNAQAAIIKMDVGSKDLQQCADAVMRLRAEFLFNEGKYDSISFKFTNGFSADYSKWRSGFKISVNGNNCKWISTNEDLKTSVSFRKYLEVVFSYAGTLSLSRQLNLVNEGYPNW
jgi:hypothetical protein